MSLFLRSEADKLPENTGVFCFLNNTNETVFAGVAENLKQEISRVLIEKDFLQNETKQIETRRFLLKKYGSLKQLKSADKADLTKVFGAQKAENAFKELQNKYEKVEPLIVPIRFDDENGDARDLQPIAKTRR